MGITCGNVYKPLSGVLGALKVLRRVELVYYACSFNSKYVLGSQDIP